MKCTTAVNAKLVQENMLNLCY